MSNEVQGATLIRPIPDVRTGALFSIAVTLSETPGEVTSVAVPDGAVGFRLYPATAVRFAVGEDPEEAATSGDASDPADIQVSELAVGSIAKANAWEVRYLPSGGSRSLRLVGAAGDEVVEVEFF